MYFVIRINYRNIEETHQILQFETIREALIAYYSGIATNLEDSTITYACAFLLNARGEAQCQPFIWNPANPITNESSEPFIRAVIHIYKQNNELNYNIEYFNEDNAYKQFFITISNDLKDNNITYVLTLITDKDGGVNDYHMFTKE